MKIALLVIAGLLIGGLSYSQTNLVNANNDFAFRFYKFTKPDADNFFISPLSLNIALAIADEGARGTTRKEIENLLGISRIDNKALKYRSLIDSTINLRDNRPGNNAQTSGRNILNIADAVWYNEKFTIKQRFFDTVTSGYHSEIHSFNPNDIYAANDLLNRWVAEKTNNKIKKIGGIDQFTLMSIINATYFMGKWEREFDESGTRPKKFYSLSHDSANIKFMNIQAPYKYYEDDTLQAVYLPYRFDQFSMLVMLPHARYGINKLENILDSDYYNKIRNKATSKEVILSFPRFKIETELHLKDKLEELGYSDMFSVDADFSGITDKKPVYCSDIIHKTYIETDEKKTEAAAVSEVVINYTSAAQVRFVVPPKVFNADHSFVFFIIDNRTLAILFMGRFVKQELQPD